MWSLVRVRFRVRVGEAGAPSLPPLVRRCGCYLAALYRAHASPLVRCPLFYTADADGLAEDSLRFVGVSADNEQAVGTGAKRRIRFLRTPGLPQHLQTASALAAEAQAQGDGRGKRSMLYQNSPRAPGAQAAAASCAVESDVPPLGEIKVAKLHVQVSLRGGRDFATPSLPGSPQIPAALLPALARVMGVRQELPGALGPDAADIEVEAAGMGQGFGSATPAPAAAAAAAAAGSLADVTSLLDSRRGGWARDTAAVGAGKRAWRASPGEEQEEDAASVAADAPPRPNRHELLAALLEGYVTRADRGSSMPGGSGSAIGEVGEEADDGGSSAAARAEQELARGAALLVLEWAAASPVLALRALAEEGGIALRPRLGLSAWQQLCRAAQAAAWVVGRARGRFELPSRGARERDAVVHLEARRVRVRRAFMGGSPREGEFVSRLAIVVGQLRVVDGVRASQVHEMVSPWHPRHLPRRDDAAPLLRMWLDHVAAPSTGAGAGRAVGEAAPEEARLHARALPLWVTADHSTVRFLRASTAVATEAWAWAAEAGVQRGEDAGGGDSEKKPGVEETPSDSAPGTYFQSMIVDPISLRVDYWYVDRLSPPPRPLQQPHSPPSPLPSPLASYAQPGRGGHGCSAGGGLSGAPQPPRRRGPDPDPGPGERARPQRLARGHRYCHRLLALGRSAAAAPPVPGACAARGELRIHAQTASLPPPPPRAARRRRAWRCPLSARWPTWALAPRSW